MLGRLSMTVEECLKAFEVFAAKAFEHPRKLFWVIGKYKYDHKPLEDAIKDLIRQRTGQADTTFEQTMQKMCRT